MLEFTTAASQLSAANNDGQRIADTRPDLIDPKTKKPAKVKIDKDVFDLKEPSDSATLMAMAQITAYHEATDAATKSRAIGALIDFMGACMPGEQYGQFYAIMVDPRRGLDGSQIGELADYIVTAAGGGRPTEPSSGSRSPSRTGGRSSTGKSSSGRAAR